MQHQRPGGCDLQGRPRRLEGRAQGLPQSRREAWQGRELGHERDQRHPAQAHPQGVRGLGPTAQALRRQRRVPAGVNAYGGYLETEIAQAAIDMGTYGGGRAVSNYALYRVRDIIFVSNGYWVFSGDWRKTDRVNSNGKFAGRGPFCARHGRRARAHEVDHLGARRHRRIRQERAPHSSTIDSSCARTRARPRAARASGGARSSASKRGARSPR